MSTELERRLRQTADEIARKYFHSHEQCGGGFHYDSCQRCNLRNDIQSALQLVREDERRTLASAVKKVSPEAARLIVAQWELIKAEQEAVLAEFLTAMREP